MRDTLSYQPSSYRLVHKLIQTGLSLVHFVHALVGPAHARPQQLNFLHQQQLFKYQTFATKLNFFIENVKQTNNKQL